MWIHCTENLPKFGKLLFTQKNVLGKNHCLKSVQIRSFFWFVFSCIRTEYGDLLRKSLYSVQIKKKSVFGHFSRNESQKTKCFLYTVILIFISNDICILQRYIKSQMFYKIFRLRRSNKTSPIA